MNPTTIEALKRLEVATVNGCRRAAWWLRVLMVQSAGRVRTLNSPFDWRLYLPDTTFALPANVSFQ